MADDGVQANPDPVAEAPRFRTLFVGDRRVYRQEPGKYIHNGPLDLLRYPACCIQDVYVGDIRDCPAVAGRRPDAGEAFATRRVCWVVPPGGGDGFYLLQEQEFNTHEAELARLAVHRRFVGRRLTEDEAVAIALEGNARPDQLAQPISLAVGKARLEAHCAAYEAVPVPKSELDPIDPAPSGDDPPDGPTGGCWCWVGGVRHDVPKGALYRLLDHFWTRDSATFDELHQSVFDGAVEAQTIRARASALNAVLVKIGVAWRLQVNSDPRHLNGGHVTRRTPPDGPAPG